MKILIGVTGEIGHGKSTVCDYISDKFGFRKHAFAHSLKAIAKIFGFTHNEVYGTQEEKLKPNKYS